MQRAWKALLSVMGILLLLMIVITLYQGLSNKSKINEDTKIEKQYDKVGTKKKMEELKQGSTSRKDYLNKLKYETAIGVPKEDQGTFMTAHLQTNFNPDKLPDGMYFYYLRGSTAGKYVKGELTKYNKTKGHFPIYVFYLNVEPSYISAKIVTQQLTGKDIPSQPDRPLGYFVQNNQIVQTYRQGKTLNNLPLRY